MMYANYKTVARREKIQKDMPDYTIVEKWECDFDRECASDPKLKDYIKRNPIQEPLKPRDALYGGRTNAFKLYHEW